MTEHEDGHGPYAFPGLSQEEGFRLAALRLKHDRLVEAQEAFFEDAADRWARVQRLRAFLEALTEQLGDGSSEEMVSWMAWARAYCDGIDPLSAPELRALHAHAVALRSLPNLPPRHPEEAMWRDMGWLESDD